MTVQAAGDIVAFVNAHLDQDEAVGSSADRDLASIACRRAILALHRPDDQHPDVADCYECEHPYPCQTVRLLAAIDAYHAAYNPDWKPLADE